jgi:transcription initiation factor TFIIIB Brf1 subunit/transcription initiation factor TFIIB
MTDSRHNPSLSHAIFATTTKTVIGNKNERINKFKRLSKVHDFSTNDYNTSVTKNAFMETQRICSTLQLPENFPRSVMTTFQKTWKQLDSGTSERNHENLIPVIIYREAKAMDIDVNIKSIFGEMRCTPKKFKSCLISTYKLFPIINHQKHIVKRIDRLCNEMKMDHKLKSRALEIFHTNKSVLMATTGNVCVGAAVSMAVFSSRLRSEYPISRIARKIKSSSSAISSRIQRVLKSRRIPSSFKAKQLDLVIPEYYKKLTGKNQN